MLLHHNNNQRKAVTLIELTVVIAIIAVLIGISINSFNAYRDWQKGIDAGEQLQAVYAAQRLYLSDFPTTNVASITTANIIAYLPDNSGALPTIVDLDGNALTINFTTTPPELTSGGGTVYDPTGPNDGQWDTGK